MEITGKVALVTGAGVGIGRAVAERVAAVGASVVVTDVDSGGAGQTVQRILAAGGEASFVAADLTTDIGSTVDFAVRTYGGIDILVNNAGGGGHIPPHFPAATPAEWGALLDLNLRVPLLAIQLVLPGMAERGGGAVVNIGSSAGIGFSEYQSPEYAAAKAGLIRATACLASLRRTHRVRVNCVVPDWVRTERAEREFAAMTGSERAAAPPWVPLPALCDQVVDFITDDTAAGRVAVLRGAEPPAYIPEDDRCG